jgi:hypothetical protein
MSARPSTNSCPTRLAVLHPKAIYRAHQTCETVRAGDDEGWRRTRAVFIACGACGACF